MFDLQQAVRAQQNIYEIIDLMAGRISHIHISDYNEYGNSLLPGKGEVDFKNLFCYLQQSYNVDTALIEVYNENISQQYTVKDALDYLKNIQ